MELEQSVLPQQTTHISAKLVTSLQILQLSSEELAQSIRQEMVENPALEIEERPVCPVCGSPLEDGACPDCMESGVREAKLTPTDAYEATSYGDLSDRPRPVDSEDEFDPLARVAADVSLSEYLIKNLQQVLPDQDLPIAQFVIGSLDDSGYLTASDEEIALACGVTVEEVSSVVAALQRQDPAGIGARGVQECLLIQIQQLAEEGRTDPHAGQILSECFSELGEHKFEAIAQYLGLELEDVVSSWEFIKSNLTPFPAYSFWQDGQRVSSEHPTYVAPDVAIKRTDQGYAVEILEAERYQLKRNEFYTQLLKDGRDLSPDDRDFIRKCASRAGFFIDCIQQRWNTLRRITECLVECQQEFLDGGVAYLKPLTRAEVAFRVGFHESTVSRATANKYILLPNRRVISFDDLFDGSLAVKDAVREIIGHENSLRPLSDQDIAHELEQNGIFIARRTVAKYREAMDILPSKLRTRMDRNGRRLRSAS